MRGLSKKRRDALVLQILDPEIEVLKARADAIARLTTEDFHRLIIGEFIDNYAREQAKDVEYTLKWVELQERRESGELTDEKYEELRVAVESMPRTDHKLALQYLGRAGTTNAQLLFAETSLKRIMQKQPKDPLMGGMALLEKTNKDADFERRINNVARRGRQPKPEAEA